MMTVKEMQAPTGSTPTNVCWRKLLCVGLCAPRRGYYCTEAFNRPTARRGNLYSFEIKVSLLVHARCCQDIASPFPGETLACPPQGGVVVVVLFGAAFGAGAQ